MFRSLYNLLLCVWEASVLSSFTALLCTGCLCTGLSAFLTRNGARRSTLVIVTYILGNLATLYSSICSVRWYKKRTIMKLSQLINLQFLINVYKSFVPLKRNKLRSQYHDWQTLNRLIFPVPGAEIRFQLVPTLPALFRRPSRHSPNHLPTHRSDRDAWQLGKLTLNKSPTSDILAFLYSNDFKNIF